MSDRSSSEERVKVRIFISSVMDGFAAFRQAAANGVREGGGAAVMAELFPSLAVSPRNACLDGVQSCDALAIIIGDRGGWATPSGSLAVEEEFDEARRRSLPILAFLHDTERDESAARLARKVSDYVAGAFRTTFRTSDELRLKVAAAVRTQAGHMQLSTADSTRVGDLLEQGVSHWYEASARVALVPERVDELVPPERIGQGELLERIYSFGHDAAVRFFDYAKGKDSGVSQAGVLSVVQSTGRHSAGIASIAMTQAGEIVLDFQVTGQERRDLFSAALVVLERDLASGLRAEMAMAAKLLDYLDPYERTGALWVGAAVLNAGNRYLVKDYPSGSVPIRLDSERVVVAEPPRKIARVNVRQSEAEIQRLVALFARLLGPRP